jgi:hypothetical protein
VKFAVKAAAVAVGMLTAVLTAGCGAYAASAATVGAAGAPASNPPQVTVRTCAAYGVRAIEHHITVTRRPAQCRGLSQAEVNQAVATAVLRVAGSAPKAVRRRREAEAARYLDHLVTALPPGVSAVPAESPASAGGRDLAMSIAALIAWLVAASSGGYVLGSWMARGGTLRRGADSDGGSGRGGSGDADGASVGSPPIVIIGHFGLALSGLVVWVAYLVTGWSALAWAAVVVLLPVAGLGMATLFVGLPGRGPAAPAAAAASAASTASTGAGGVGGAGSIRADPGGTPATLVGTRGTGTVSVRTRLSPLIVAGHGALAVTTIVLVLLAALGAAAH